ncbi:unnamed protein product, partial [Schistosoma mattheei]
AAVGTESRIIKLHNRVDIPFETQFNASKPSFICVKQIALSNWSLSCSFHPGIFDIHTLLSINISSQIIRILGYRFFMETTHIKFFQSSSTGV